MINLHLGWLMKRFIIGKQVQKPGAPTRLGTQEPLNTRLRRWAILTEELSFYM